MKNLVLDRKSIKNRLGVSTLFLLFLQVTFLLVTIFGSGVNKKLSDEYLKIFNDHVTGRKNELEKVMLGQWANLRDFESYIQREANNFNLHKNPKLIPVFLENIGSRAVLALRQRGTTGVFIILEGEEHYEGIYLRDTDPYFHSPDNSDLILERGPIGVARKTNASLGSQWEYQFGLSEDEEESYFYYKPFLAAKENPDTSYEDLGYWSRSSKLYGEDLEVITYSLPLIGLNGLPYGVVGIEVTLDYLSTYMPYGELAERKQGSYLLGIEEVEGVFQNIVSTGPLFKRLSGGKKKTFFTHQSKPRDIYIMNKNKRVDEDVYGSVQHLNLYKSNSPFKNEKWALVGIVEKKILFGQIRHIIKSIGLSLLISLCIGLVAVYGAMNWFTAPITRLVEQVLTSDPHKPIVLSKTNITEIDELALAIETLSGKVADSSSKLSQIISMVKVPIGAFEYTVGESRVFFTDTLFNILGITNKHDQVNYITTDVFET